MVNQSQKLDIILVNSPSIIRNSIIVQVIRICSLILSLILFFFGISLLTSYFVGSELIINHLRELFNKKGKAIVEDYNLLLLFLGGVLTFCGLILGVLSWVCKMVLKRNSYIFETLLVIEETKSFFMSKSSD
jgi:hypothetical protein